MDYPLAIQLAQAGFTFHHDVDQDCIGHCQIPDNWGDDESVGQILHWPYLDELIDACGDNFISLNKTNVLGSNDKELVDCWQAIGLLKEPFNLCKMIADDRTKACAYLWLALNPPREQVE